ncbi:MAG: heavy metal translocating P-type ATPase metal-binding domain-containing protein [bacterium]
MALFQSKSTTEVTCFHCGEICENTRIFKDDKFFCCQGYRLVFEMLSENNLQTYYHLEVHPGRKVESLHENKRFGFLDDPAIVKKLLDFTGGKICKVTFRIPQMHCSACIWLLENFYKLDAGVSQSRVNFLRKELSLAFREEETSLRKVEQRYFPQTAASATGFLNEHSGEILHVCCDYNCSFRTDILVFHQSIRLSSIRPAP